MNNYKKKINDDSQFFLNNPQLSTMYTILILTHLGINSHQNMTQTLKKISTPLLKL